MYGKIFHKMYDGSLRQLPWQVTVTFQQLIVLADKHGEVDMSLQAIALRTGIPSEILGIGIFELSKPDSASRNPTEEGRRIVLLSEDRSWGWRIVNYEHYRTLRNEEERREYQRQYWRDNRSPTVRTQQASTDTQQDLTNSTKAVRSKQNAERKRKTTKDPAAPVGEPGALDLFPTSVCDRLYNLWLNRRGGIDYGRFRKALKPFFPATGPMFTDLELEQALEVFAEIAECQPPDKSKWWTITRFAEELPRWVDLGKVPAQDEFGCLTERGRLCQGIA